MLDLIKMCSREEIDLCIVPYCKGFHHTLLYQQYKTLQLIFRHTPFTWRKIPISRVLRKTPISLFFSVYASQDILWVFLCLIKDIPIKQDLSCPVLTTILMDYMTLTHGLFSFQGPTTTPESASVKPNVHRVVILVLAALALLCNNVV